MTVANGGTPERDPRIQQAFGLFYAQALAIAACPISLAGHKHVSFTCLLCSPIASAISAAAADYSKAPPDAG